MVATGPLLRTMVVVAWLVGWLSTRQAGFSLTFMSSERLMPDQLVESINLFVVGLTLRAESLVKTLICFEAIVLRVFLTRVRINM
jgi:hypothetical protein